MITLPHDTEIPQLAVAYGNEAEVGAATRDSGLKRVKFTPRWGSPPRPGARWLRAPSDRHERIGPDPDTFVSP